MATQATFTVASQADGRQYVTYKFITDAGDIFFETSLQASDFDPNTTLAVQVTRWDALLNAGEIAANIDKVANNGGGAFIFKYSTQAQAIAALRQTYKSETQRRLHKIAAWLIANLTDNQLSNAFGGLTAPQLTALKAKLQAASDRLTAWDAEAGQ